MKESIKRYGFVVPIITNRDLLVADGEHRLRAAKELGMKQVSVVRLPVNDVDRRMIRQVMNKIRGEHDLFLDAEEYYRLVSEGSRDLLKGLLNESDLRIDNLLRLREPFAASDEEFRNIAERFRTRIESNKLDAVWEQQHPKEKLSLSCHVEFSTRAEVTERTLAVCEAFGLGVDESRRFVVFDDFNLTFCRGDLICITGDSGGGKSLLLDSFMKYFGDEAVSLDDLEIDPEEIALFINENWKENSTRRIAVCVYDSFLKSIGQTWNKPKYKQESKKPFIPTDEELHQAILTGKKPNMTFSQLLYETGARTNEAERVQWEDIDYARKKSTSKHPKTEMHDSSQ